MYLSTVHFGFLKAEVIFNTKFPGMFALYIILWLAKHCICLKVYVRIRLYREWCYHSYADFTSK